MTGFKAVRYEGLYQGIDLRIGIGAGRLSATFMLGPGADPSLILFKAEGANANRIGSPVAYQLDAGYRTTVNVAFEASRYGSTRLNLGPYDVSKPVEIDFLIGY